MDKIATCLNCLLISQLNTYLVGISFDSDAVRHLSSRWGCKYTLRQISYR